MPLDDSGLASLNTAFSKINHDAWPKYRRLPFTMGGETFVPGENRVYEGPPVRCLTFGTCILETGTIVTVVNNITNLNNHPKTPPSMLCPYEGPQYVMVSDPKGDFPNRAIPVSWKMLSPPLENNMEFELIADIPEDRRKAQPEGKPFLPDAAAAAPPEA